MVLKAALSVMICLSVNNVKILSAKNIAMVLNHVAYVEESYVSLASWIMVKMILIV